MMNKSTIKKIEDFAKEYCKKDKEDPELWEGHVQLVRKYAIKLAEIENVDRDVVEIAAILHDIGKDKGREKHNERSYKLSKEFLKEIELPQDKKDLILKSVLKHSSRFLGEDNEIEVKVVQCADKLGVLFHDEWQEYSRKHFPKEELIEKYKKTLNKLNLDSARKIAEPQVKKLIEKLK